LSSSLEPMARLGPEDGREASAGAAGVLDLLRRTDGQRVLVVTHEAPDGDAIGSLLGMTQLVRACGGEPLALCLDRVPDAYSFLDGAGDVRTEVPEGWVPGVTVFVDCANPERAGNIRPWVAGLTVNIDHHVSNTRFAEINWVDELSSSTGEMLGGLFGELGIEFGRARDALYVAIVTDTGSFSYESTRPATHQLAARLLAAGAQPQEIHEHIHGNRQRPALALLGRALASLKTQRDGRIAYMVLGPEDFAAADAGIEHTNGIVNYARELAGAVVGILFSSTDGQLVKIGLRTRPGVDANCIAAQFGGGGHPRAAGCRCQEPLDRVIPQVLHAAGEQLSGS